MKIIKLLAFITLFYSCSNQKVYDDDFYDLVNYILLEYDSTASIVEMPLLYKIYDHTKFLNSPPPPNSYDAVSIMDTEFNWFIDKKYISEEDASFLIGQAENDYRIPFDSNKMHFITILNSKIDSLYQLDKMNSITIFLMQEYSNPQIIFFSKPLFSENKNKVYFQVDYFCGNLCGYGKIYLCEKDETGWKIVYEVESWFS